MSRTIPYFAMLLVGLAACTVGPHYAPPRGIDANTAWQRLAPGDPRVAATTDPDPRWWNAYGDAMLSRLIGMAIAGNPDLQQSVLRVVEARQSVATARAAGLPTLGANASYMREQLGLKGILESDGAYSQLNTLANEAAPVLNQASPGLGATARSNADNLLNPLTSPVNLFQYGLDASWELDLFGRVRRSVEQAKASAQAQAEATNDALLMLEAEVAQAYVQLREAQALAASQTENVKADQESLELTKRLGQQGLNTSLDVDQATTQLDNDERQLPQYEKQAAQAIDQLNVLTGKPPGTLDAMLAEPSLPLTLPALVGIGLPSTLARRRPDIREAEAQLHAATANVGVAVANFYPDISLTGNLGIRATDASYLTNWASHFYSAGPSISLPIFQGGRLIAGLRMARAQQAAAALSYRGTVLNALREVEDALVAYRTDRAARDKLADTVGWAADTEYLSTSRYRSGLSDYLQVLDARRSLVAARQQLIQANMGLITDTVRLYRAAGGGWQGETGAIAAPAINPAPPPVPAAADALAQ